MPLLEGVSSTEIRRHLHAGEVKEAARLLGRPPELDGVVVTGDQRGGTLGYPTANLAVDPSVLVPRYGIYAGSALDHRAAISIGTNPHYGGEERRIEPHLLDFEGDLYGKRLLVELWERLRDEQVFESEQELIDQIAPRRRSDAGSRPPAVGRLKAVSENGPMIHARGLVKRFGELVAVDGIDLDVQRGRGLRLPRPERRRQELDDADDRLRLAGQRRGRSGSSASIRPPTGRRSAPGSASSRSRTRSTPS